MITENLSSLTIHKLKQEQYDRELAAGRIDENALYLTPYEEVTDEQITAAVNAYLEENPVEIDIPTTLPNPHKLTFTGAVSAEYDGSEAVEVNIPAGGGGGAKTSGWVLINDTFVSAADKVSKLEFTTDADGNPFAYDELLLRTTRANNEGFGATTACAASLEINKYSKEYGAGYGFKFDIVGYFPTGWGDKGIYINPIRAAAGSVARYVGWDVLATVIPSNTISAIHSQSSNGEVDKLTDFSIATNNAENYMCGRFILYGRNRT